MLWGQNPGPHKFEGIFQTQNVVLVCVCMEGEGKEVCEEDHSGF